MEIITPYKNEDGITFYISNDGKETGISIAGLERLLGLESNSRLFTKSQNKLMWRMVEEDSPLENDPKCLKPLWGKVFNPNGVGSDGAKIIRSEVMVAIIEYYAFERNNPVAKHSYRAFAKIGVDTWIKESTGYALEDKYDNLLGLVQELLTEVKVVRYKVDKLDKLESTMVTLYPGARHITEGWSNGDKTLSDDNIYTIKDWLQLNDVTLDKSSYHSLALLAAETYRTLTGKNPVIKYKDIVTKKGRKNKMKVGNGYKLIDFYILEAAFKKLLSKAA